MTTNAAQTSKDEYTSDKKKTSRSNSKAKTPKKTESSEVIPFDRAHAKTHTAAFAAAEPVMPLAAVTVDAAGPSAAAPAPSAEPTVVNAETTAVAAVEPVKLDIDLTAEEAQKPKKKGPEDYGWVGKIFTSVRVSEAPTESSFGLHPKISLLLLFAAMTIAILSAVLESPRAHQILALFAGTIYGLLFGPHMRIWHKRPAEPQKSKAEIEIAMDAQSKVKG